ncbi:MAG: type IX secretion system sortase PorU [Bacteroidetes bacterium]|nr:type IX secretion system sortase PorU [Bacteroidota bacterium]
MNKQFMHFAGIIIWFFLPFMGISQNSVLSDGTWYKLSVSETGVYKITYDDLLNWGIDPGLLNPESIAIYGNGNGMLPESPDEFRYDDLQEIAIKVVGEEDQSFDMDDFILFYGEGPTEWNVNESTGKLIHETNLYSDEVFYFLNLDMPDALRLQTQYSTVIPPTNFSDSYSWNMVYEPELENLIHSGKIWFAERFDDQLTHDFPISIPNLKIDQPVMLGYRVAARSSVASFFSIYADGVLLDSKQIVSVNFGNSLSNYARINSGEVEFFPNDEDFNLTFEYEQPNDSATGWLDYFTLSAKRNLIFEGPQMFFSDQDAYGPGMLTQFDLDNASSAMQIWNVTDPLLPADIDFDLTGSVAEYTLETESMLQFLAFTDSDLTPEFIGAVENQNLHGMTIPEMVIITAPEFESAASTLGGFRESNNNLSVAITSPQIIYNEFSSGAQDVTAIRDFVKYLYEKSNGENPKYLLLMGDASVDYKDRLENNTNFVPTWESEESLSPVGSYCSDDYFVRFSEGFILSLALGRIPAETVTEADIFVQNLMQYASQGNTGNWHNQLALIADDEDGNLHFADAEEIADSVNQLAPYMNVSKIYLDAFPQITLPNGEQRYPEVNEAINQQINDGVLVINYQGHGGYNYLAHEQVMTPEDIQSWNNVNKLPVFMTFTCAFGQMDDPEVNPMFMELLSKEYKGMVAVLSPTRPTYASANMSICKKVYSNWLNDPDRAFGRDIQLAKNSSNSIENASKFIFFGDPAMRIAVPLLQVKTESIKGIPVEEFTDTLHPGSFITLDGYILSEEGNLVSGFNGELTIQVFDRSETRTTLGNDTSIYITDFEVQDSVVKVVSTSVTNGHWETEFFLPNDMDSVYGNIKLSYYAWTETEDAAGYFKDILVGGLQASVWDRREDALAIQVYPTMTDDRMFIQIDKDCKNVSCELINLSGEHFELLRMINYKKGMKGELNVSEFPAGFYILTITADAFIQSRKIIIK